MNLNSVPLFIQYNICRDKDRERRRRGGDDEEYEEKVRIKVEPPDGKF